MKVYCFLLVLVVAFLPPMLLFDSSVSPTMQIRSRSAKGCGIMCKRGSRKIIFVHSFHPRPEVLIVFDDFKWAVVLEG